jgi:transglutaminase-like putative cysteine protease
MKISCYSRSDELNRKRTDIKAAVAAFTFDDIASGISGITEAFGFTFNYESHKLGTSDTISYTNQTDLTVTLNKAYEGAVYLKGYAGAIYEGNEWSELDENIYETSDIFDDFSNYGIYPQDFLKIFSNAVYTDSADITLDIDSVRKRNKSYAPYGTGNYGNTDYRYDETVSSKQNGNSCYSYKFTGIDIYNISDFLSARTRNTYSSESITDKQRQEQIKEFCSDNDLFTYQNYFIIDSEISPDIITQQGTYSNGSIIMAALLDNKYRDFVYENYMQIPDNENMDEVYTAFEDILSESDSSSTAADKIKILENIRDRIASMTQYTLSPGKTPSNRDFVNYFLFENQKGYCTHYATAGVILARMAGIPARYATGYLIVGDDFNDSARQSDGSYVINLPDSRSHAWAEVYIDGAGWIPFEFTAGYSSMTIDTTVTATTAVEETATETVTTVTEKSSDSQENTSQENTRQTSDENISSSAVSSSIGTTTAVSGKVVPEKHSFTITPVMRNIIISVAILICIILLIYLRRYIIIITGRKRRRTVSAEQAEFIYSYVGKLLAILKIYRGNMTYMEFADYVENTLGGIYFEKGGFKLMMSAILESGFSERQISQETAAEICDFTEQLATSIYGKSSVFVRIYMKFILALI